MIGVRGISVRRREVTWSFGFEGYAYPPTAIWISATKP